MTDTHRDITDEIIKFTLPDGRRAVALLPAIPDGAPDRIREGIARRRITATTGTCPCGATIDYETVATAGAHVDVQVLHDPWCPADTDRLTRWIRAWRRAA